MLKKDYQANQIDKRAFILTKWFLLRKLSKVEAYKFGKIKYLSWFWKEETRRARLHIKTGIVEYLQCEERFRNGNPTWLIAPIDKVEFIEN